MKEDLARLARRRLQVDFLEGPKRHNLNGIYNSARI